MKKVTKPCEECSIDESKVTDSRQSWVTRQGQRQNTVRRRRECLKCKRRFTTVEVVVDADFLDRNKELLNEKRSLCR